MRESSLKMYKKTNQDGLTVFAERYDEKSTFMSVLALLFWRLRGSASQAVLTV